MKKLGILLTSLLLIVTLGACSSSKKTAKLGVAYGAAHGTKCFTVAAVVIDGETGAILDAVVDEYQYVSATDFTGVPNSDGGFGENYAEGVVLASKKVNNEGYSALLAAHASATQTYTQSMSAVEDFTVGKTAAELTSVDSVTGSTLTDSANYVALIATAATYAESNDAYDYEGEVELHYIEGAAHGDKCFSIAITAVADSKVVAAYVDEFQYLGTTSGATPVPNGDNTEGFAAGNKAEVMLCSKKVNNSVYSALLAANGGATQEYAQSMAAIEAEAAGKTAEELKAIDGISGSTLTDTNSYLSLIADSITNNK